MHQHLVWRTQWHTLARVIIITVWMPVRPCVPRCCCDVYCHREGREEERQLGHDAMTRVVVVAAGCEHHVAWWHQQTTQHSKGKGRGGAATRTVTHPPSPLSHQHKQATTSLQLLARGWWCGCVKHASPSPSPPAHTPAHLMTQRWRSVGEQRRGRRSKWDGRGSHQQRQWVQSQPHGITAALPCLHTCRVRQRGGGEKEWE